MGLVDAYTTDDVTITSKGTLGGDGAYDWDGASKSVKARVEHKSGVRKSGDGKEWVYTLKIYFRGDATIALQDRVTFDGSNYTVKDLDSFDGLDGKLDHYVAYCG